MKFSGFRDNGLKLFEKWLRICSTFLKHFWGPQWGHISRQFDIENWTKDLLVACKEITFSLLCIFFIDSVISYHCHTNVLSLVTNVSISSRCNMLSYHYNFDIMSLWYWYHDIMLRYQYPFLNCNKLKLIYCNILQQCLRHCYEKWLNNKTGANLVIVTKKLNNLSIKAFCNNGIKANSNVI